MKQRILVLGGVVLMLLSVNVFAADTEVESLKQELNSLKGQVEELKAIIKQQQQIQQDESKRIEKLAVEKAEKKESPVISNFKFKPYGYIKLDAAYDDSRTNLGDFILYVPNESQHKNDNEYSMTAKQTRLGLDIMAPEIYAWQAWGRIEFDFYGDGGAAHENKAGVLLRHAFVELKKKNFSLLAGQTSDLISPLNIDTLNYTVGWSVGNIGYRRPQLRGTYTYPFSKSTKIISALALARTTGTINEDLDLDLQNDGEDAGFPTVQGRLAVATKLLTANPTVFGVSGHYGEEEIDWQVKPLTPGKRQTRVKTWSINGDCELPLTSKLSVKGEFFTGYNLDDYFGGILQGVNPTTREVIKSMGGWMQVSYKQSDKWNYRLGFGIDDPEEKDLSNNMRSRNSFYFGNVVYSLIPPVDIGLEYSFWETDHKGISKGTDNRIQTSIIYKW
jgi:hypothetical protein